MELTLYIASTARDTDFTGKLVDVYPDGKALLLTDGILRARYRHSFSHIELLEPGTVYGMHICIAKKGTRGRREKVGKSEHACTNSEIFC